MAIPYNTFINARDLGATIDAGGPLVHYIDDGAGPPMLFLHGLGFSLFTFRRNYPFFVRNMRIVAPDLPGCGYSRLPGDYGASPERIAGYLKNLLDGLSIPRAVVCGAGEGGVYALELAIRYPDSVSALVLSSPGSLTMHFPKAVRRLADPVFGSLRIGAMDIRHMREFVKWCWFNEIAVDNYIVRQVYRPFESRHARLVLLRLLREYDGSFAHANLKNVQCPTLIVWGEADAGRPCGMASLYAREIPNASVQIIRNCGMLPHEEKPAEFNERVEQFLLAVLPEMDPAAVGALSEELTDYSAYEDGEGE